MGGCWRFQSWSVPGWMLTGLFNEGCTRKQTTGPSNLCTELCQSTADCGYCYSCYALMSPSGIGMNPPACWRVLWMFLPPISPPSSPHMYICICIVFVCSHCGDHPPSQLPPSQPPTHMSSHNPEGRCEDEKMWGWEDVKMRRCEDVRMRRYEDEQMWRWEDVKMWGCEDKKMWRCEDVKMWGCEDEKMWRWEDVRMRRCEDEKMWRWEDVKMRRCFADPHYWKNPVLRRSREKNYG